MYTCSCVANVRSVESGDVVSDVSCEKVLTLMPTLDGVCGSVSVVCCAVDAVLSTLCLLSSCCSVDKCTSCLALSALSSCCDPCPPNVPLCSCTNCHEGAT